MSNLIYRPEIFENFYSSFYNYNISLFNEVKKRYIKPNTILDLGCGTGLSTRALAKIFNDSHILGVDSNESLIDKANASFIPINVDYKIFNAIKIDALEKKFDTIFIKSVYHLLEIESKSFLDKCFKILNENGTIYIIERTEKSLKSFPLFDEAKELWKTQYKAREGLCNLSKKYDVEHFTFGQHVSIPKEIYLKGISSKQMSCLWSFNDMIIEEWINNNSVDEEEVKVLEEYDIFSIKQYS
ncbi:hypothetical protein CRV03_05795 [Arcobacter sp. F155]|uniref:class I SAM-dependent methyltransferase n=1 Tax=Arcobacter sp. F155 TaxID=2044512 RepID=UPI00100B7B28|nr:class I SAM-dependent methyltransferase [Arcobacter sp. F155]RXJ77196.1 hypothetical protein CRV03_05795 [Arcobacter sp. F155]